MRSQYLPTLASCLLVATGVAAVGVYDFDWETITPSRKLEYHACYGEYQCARLTVPLDWLDETGSNPHVVDLAITRLPATVPETDPSYGGDIFTNPGGPGGSGVAHVLAYGHMMRNVTSDADRRYAILSWDPRGVGFTTPNADCYAGDFGARDIAEIEGRALGHLLGDGDDTLRRQWARTRAYGRLCTQSAATAADNGSFSILPYLTTPSVVRDMVAMLDQIEELRNKEEAERVVQVDDSNKAERRLELRETEKIEQKKKEVPRLLYWGFSYGTLLGNTFASMFPGRVGRVILDGVCDADDYMAGVSILYLLRYYSRLYRRADHISRNG
jgi:pimeloyl-ACP methyl ester carboxylesterase